MGIDWYCMRPRVGADSETLRDLVESQALSFQSIPGSWLTESIELVPRSDFEESEKQYLPTYLESSKALAALLELPEPNDEGEESLDLHGIDACRRTYFVTRNQIFPPQWQVSYYRTILPDTLPSVLHTWRTWLEEVRNGRFRDYLFALWCYYASLDLHDHWHTLMHTARQSLEKTTNWSRKPEFMEIREKVLDYAEPSVCPAPIWIPPTGYAPPFCDATRSSIEGEAESLVSLTRCWDSRVKGSWKVRIYREYHRTFNEYLQLADSEWVVDSLEWV